MTMEKAKLCVIAFDAADVITTSTPGQALYYFKGLGSDVSGDYGRDLSITLNNKDVTEDYVYPSSGYKMHGSENDYPLDPNTTGYPYVDSVISSELSDSGIQDGAYTLSDSKFSPYQ